MNQEEKNLRQQIQMLKSQLNEIKSNEKNSLEERLESRYLKLLQRRDEHHPHITVAIEESLIKSNPSKFRLYIRYYNELMSNDHFKNRIFQKESNLKKIQEEFQKLQEKFDKALIDRDHCQSKIDKTQKAMDLLMKSILMK